jgi:hypothetical protein
MKLLLIFSSIKTRILAKKTKSFSNFVEKIRVCLVFYLSIEYVCNQVSEVAKKVNKQTQIAFETDFFSQ